jgi:alkanesulfonate monooxygenase SsuD/methylene tetrahydromethanopterin reductase-like flavin-dependent oxidoreductase (luciferase family)
VKFGLFYQLPCAPEQSEAARYQETIEQIILADELGFDIAWLAELHFFRQFSIMPGPLYIATAAAQRTRRIRFGTGVILLPFHHPLRIAEEAAVVDILTGGRLEFGVGRGTIAVHFQGFGVSRNESRGRFEEALRIVQKAWTDQRFSHDGSFYQIPETMVVPKPLQKPHPPIRIAANSSETSEFAGMNGYNVLVASPINPMPGIFEHIGKYRAALERAGHPAGKGDVAALFFTCATPSLEAARAEYEHSLLHYFRTIGEQAKLGDRSQYEGSYQYLRDVRERAARMDWDTVERTMGLFGPPAECVRRIHELYEGARINQLVCWFNPGGRVPHREVMASMERFAASVIPSVRSLGD